MITRLNCSNCEFLSSKKEPVDKEDLNSQGGMKNQTPAEESRARKIKLITLPGKMDVSFKHWCEHSDVDQWVTQHMWCRRWEASGTLHQK